jgi:hypothetical protein
MCEIHKNADLKVRATRAIPKEQPRTPRTGVRATGSSEGKAPRVPHTLCFMYAPFSKEEVLFRRQGPVASY